MENANQKNAIIHFTNPAIVLAGPGSGKTFVIIRHIKYLMTEKNVSGDNILVITFTRNSANEMKERFLKLCSDEKICIDKVPTFGTFHSVFFEMLRNSFGYNENSLIKSEEEILYLTQVLSNYKNVNVSKGKVEQILKDIKGYKLAKEKNEKFIPKSIDKKIFFDIYNDYKTYLYDRKKLDFYDMIELLKEFLEKDKKALSFYQEKFKYILIDEFQDINYNQYSLVKLICATKNIYAVGDDDQSIYEFRGSTPSVVNNFIKDYKNTKVYILNQNYRSAKTIVDFSNQVISHNKKRVKKQLLSEIPGPGNIYIKSFIDSKDENKFILSIIKDLQKKGKKLKDIAILYRTNLVSLSIVDALAHENIKIDMKDKSFSIYEHFAVKDILSYLYIFAGSRDPKHFINIINKPVRYVDREAIKYGDCDIARLKKHYANKKYVLGRLLGFEIDIAKSQGLSPPQAIRYIRKNINYDKYLETLCNTKQMCYYDIEELLDTFEEVSVNYKSIEEFLRYVESTKEIKDDLTNDDKVNLMTFHLAKGLEYDTVVIIDANDLIIPHKKSIKDKDIETERRLFYVAITRAKNNLYICFTKNRFGKTYAPSRFIKEGIKGGLI